MTGMLRSLPVHTDTANNGNYAGHARVSEALGAGFFARL